MDKHTRKELKSDKFALEVQHSVEYVSVHRQQMMRYGAPALALVLIIAGVLYYRNYQHNARQEALHQAMRIQNAQVGPSQTRIRDHVSHGGGAQGCGREKLGKIWRRSIQEPKRAESPSFF